MTYESCPKPSELVVFGFVSTTTAAAGAELQKKNLHPALNDQNYYWSMKIYSLTPSFVWTKIEKCKTIYLYSVQTYLLSFEYIKKKLLVRIQLYRLNKFFCIDTKFHIFKITTE